MQVERVNESFYLFNTVCDMWFPLAVISNIGTCLCVGFDALLTKVQFCQETNGDFKRQQNYVFDSCAIITGVL